MSDIIPDAMQGPNGTSHWRLDTNGQLVDNAEWDLADEIVKLQIGNDGTETQVRTFIHLTNVSRSCVFPGSFSVRHSVAVQP